MNIFEKKINKILISKKVKNTEIITRIKKILKNKPMEIINDENLSVPVDLTKGKKILYLTENKTNFLKKCPGTPIYRCCLYEILHIGEHCPMDCSYCILQAYFQNPYLTLFTNLDDMMRELEVAEKENQVKRIGTGEFTDSFALANLGNWHELLIPFFSKSKKMFLELKTKFADESFLKYNHNRHIIISFSLNTFKIQKEEELLTSSITDRIKLAKKAFENGFINSFHFDPIIDYPNAEKEYQEIVNLIFDNIPEKNICWISLGTLRYIPYLKEIAQKRFIKTKIYSYEFHKGLDGKCRYFITRRIELYNAIITAIKKRSKNVPIYFCMENEAVWKNTLGFFPKSNEELSRLLDKAIINTSKNF